MKKIKGIISIFLCTLLILQTACGNIEKEQNASGIGANQMETESGLEGGGEMQPPQESPPFLHRDWTSSSGEVIQTWEKDYTSAEWEDGVCLNIYVRWSSSDWSREIEDELNHRLHLAGYDFYINFVQPDEAEFNSMEYQNMRVDELVVQQQQSGVAIDMYMTNDYQAAVESGIVLDMTDYLRSEDGRNLYAHFEQSVWQQLESVDGRIYGIPANPVATTRYVYAYTPQLTNALGIDMTAFDGDVTMFETRFPEMLEQGIAPITYVCRDDLLMFSMFGLEKYKEIFAVRHTEDEWEAIDLFEEEGAISFYEQLGDWREKGFLFYEPAILRDFGAISSSELNTNQFNYRFLELIDVDMISWSHDVNMAEDGYVATAFYVPQGQAFITKNINSQIFVIYTDTQYPQECMQFLDILTTNKEMRMLLYNGIENYHYMWLDDVLIYENGSGHAFIVGSLGLIYDLSFWPAGHWGEKYATEIEELNQNVSEGISLTVDCDFAGLKEQYEACCQLFEENILVFLGYYGAETGERLQALHEQLNEAGYQELIEAVNAMR